MKKLEIFGTKEEIIKKIKEIKLDLHLVTTKIITLEHYLGIEKECDLSKMLEIW